ncbi:MAG TPA: 30S ribosomal protein S20 [Gemmatimonadota bacterium]|nr:30S ribosomal protein S20 [Gemmatimonadota bacterium]
MPNIKSAKKRLKQSRKRREHNKDVKSSIRTVTKRLLQTESHDEADEMLRQATSMLDRAARRGILPTNAVARRKSRLTRYVSSLES